MSRSTRLRRVALVAIALTVYIASGKLGLQLAFVNASATAVWVPAGVALALLLLAGRRAWPIVFVGAFVVNVTTAGSFVTAVAIAAGNTLEAVLGAWLVERFAGGRHAFERAPDIFKAAALAGLASPMVAATIGVATLTIAGYVPHADVGVIWTTWWLGDAAGALIVAPLILVWSSKDWLEPSGGMLEVLALLTCVCVVGLFVFGDVLPVTVHRLVLDFACMPVLVWAAYRYGARGATASVALLSAIAVWGTLHGQGPFTSRSVNVALLTLQVFTAVVAVTSLTLAAVVAQHRAAERRLAHVAVTDGLTGLGNYRRLIGALELEIARERRAGRPFAVLFLDVDRLKLINDRYGHIVGSRALVRVGRAIMVSCREIDLAARYGGDEFAVVLPEADERAAHALAQRITRRLGADEEVPRVSVSVGIAISPRDGSTPQALLAMADQGLYRQKHVRGETLRRDS